MHPRMLIISTQEWILKIYKSIITYEYFVSIRVRHQAVVELRIQIYKSIFGRNFLTSMRRSYEILKTLQPKIAPRVKIQTMTWRFNSHPCLYSTQQDFLNSLIDEYIGRHLLSSIGWHTVHHVWMNAIINNNNWKICTATFSWKITTKVLYKLL